MMRNYQISVFFCLALSAFSQNALAHGIHLGELAGHSHWVGWGAMLGAAAIGAAIAFGKKKKQKKIEQKSSQKGSQKSGQTKEADAPSQA